jgi:2-dehydro-3-deoxygluconokinase
MLRFDPGFGRVRNARSFGCGKAAAGTTSHAPCAVLGQTRNGHHRCRNDLGWLVEDLMMQGGVDTSKIIWREFDGLGRNTRVGLNFTEKGFGIRAALGCSDRGHSAASQIKPGEVNWEKLFGEEGVRWFHTGGIFAALAPNTSEAVIEAVEIARKYGTIVSYDLNYRASLWKSQGGKEGAQKIIATSRYVDGDRQRRLHRLPGVRSRRPRQLSTIDPATSEMIQTAVKRFRTPRWPRPLRNAKTATFNDWWYPYAGSLLSVDDARTRIYHDRVARRQLRLRVSRTAMGRKGPQAAVEYGPRSAPAMTTPGDTSMVNVKEVEAVMKGEGARHPIRSSLNGGTDDDTQRVFPIAGRGFGHFRYPLLRAH